MFMMFITSYNYIQCYIMDVNGGYITIVSGYITIVSGHITIVGGSITIVDGCYNSYNPNY